MKVLITGVSRGLGRGLAEKFLAAGCDVAGIARENTNIPDAIRFFRGDVSDFAGMREIAARLSDTGFTPDVVILNAATMESDIAPDGTFDTEMFEKIIHINLISALKITGLFLPAFIQRRSGAFVAISSLAGVRAIVKSKIAYPAGKAGLSMAFESLRIQYTGSGVRFITLMPGPLGERGSLMMTSYSRAAEKIANHILRGRKRDILEFGWLPALITRICRFLPDRAIAGLLKMIRD